MISVEAFSLTAERVDQKEQRNNMYRECSGDL